MDPKDLADVAADDIDRKTLEALGSVALRGLPIAQYPEVVPPTVSVTTNYPGASAKVVADTVAAQYRQGFSAEGAGIARTSALLALLTAQGGHRGVADSLLRFLAADDDRSEGREQRKNP